MADLLDRSPGSKTLIGMIHLPPLPGYEGAPLVEETVQRALDDLATLERAGFHGALIENEYDRPHRVSAAAETVAVMTTITREAVRARQSVAVGCEILLNDPRASIATALAGGASFIRTDYFVDRMTRPGYGEFDIDPEGLIAYRASLGAQHVHILADIQVKYATMIAPRPLSESAALARDHGAAAVVVSGTETGRPPSPEELRSAAQGAKGIPVLIGSGLTADNAEELLAACDGAIVGTAIMKDGRVDQAAAAAVMRAAGFA